MTGHRFASLCATLAIFAAACSPMPQEQIERRLNRAEGFLAAGDTASAIAELEHTDLETDSSSDAITLLGRLHRHRGSIESRLESQKVLERALQLFPNDPVVSLELGTTYFRQGFYPDAERYLSNAIEMDPNYCEARRLLGDSYYSKWKRVNEYTDDLSVARDMYRSALECDSTDVRAAIRYLYSLYPLGDTLLARNDTERLIIRFPDRPELYFLRGTLAYDQSQFFEADRDYKHALELLDDDAASVYLRAHYAIGFSGQDEYAASTHARHGAMDRVFWLNADPDATTEINERHIEHIYRCFLADLYFSLPPTRGWDTDRGKTLIKFGWPTSIQSTLAGRWLDGHAENWNYVVDDNFFQFTFVDETLSGNLRIPKHQDASLSFMLHQTRLTRFRPGFESLPCALNAVAFKDDEMTSSVYVVMRVDADSLENIVNTREFDRFYLRWTFFDDEWTAEHRFADTLWTAEVPVLYASKRRVFELVRRTRLPFDRYHLAWTFEDALGKTSAQMKVDCDTRRYVSNDVTLSDLLLLRQNRRNGAVIRRADRTLYPNAGGVYDTRSPLSVYFEIYNLAAHGGRSEYDVTFSIYEASVDGESAWLRWGRHIAAAAGLSRREATISQTLRRNAAGHTAAEELRINMDELDDGRYELVVTVSDRLSGKSSQSSVSFLRWR